MYLYCQEHEPEYVFLQEIPVNNGMINYKLETSSVHMNSMDISFSQCKGLLCTDEQGNDCGTCWEGDELPEYRPVVKNAVTEPVNEMIEEAVAEPVIEMIEEAVAESVNGMVEEAVAESVNEMIEEAVAEPMIEMVEPAMAEPVRKMIEKTVAEPMRETIEESATEPVMEMLEEIAAEPIHEAVQIESESEPEPESTNGETQDTNTSRTHRPRTFPELWEHMQKEFPTMEPFEDNTIVETIKIAPSDLGYLQASNLNLGTNQFLLHGYKSYQHLLLGRLHGQMRYVIGVPGVYDPQEQFMAKMFGFPCFKPIRECRQKNGQFGYWLRCFR